MKHLYIFLLFLIVCAGISYAQSENMEYGMGCLPETDVASLPKSPQLLERDFKGLPLSYSLLQYCPKPQSQGQYGTCTSWATAYAFRTILDAVRYGWNDTETITENAYSPLFIYAQIKNPYDIDCRQGSHISDAMKRLRDVGAVKKTIFDFMCASSIPANIMNEAAPNKIDNFSTLVTYGQHLMEPVKISVVKKAIAEKQPVVIAMHVFPSFHNCKDVWDGNTSGISGYHAMCVVAYDDNKYGGSFLIQNSWGESWGNGGFIWIKYKDFCQTVDQAYTGSLPFIPSPVIKKNILGGSLSLQLSTGASMQPMLNNNMQYPYYEIRGSYISGTRYRVYLTNHEPAYVYIIGSDLKSNTSKIFPPRDDISPVLSYKQSHIAIPDDKWYMEMDNNVGTDYMCVLYSMHELNINRIISLVKARKGSFVEKIVDCIGSDIASIDDITFDSNRITFKASTNGTVVPIIIAMHHE